MLLRVNLDLVGTLHAAVREIGSEQDHAKDESICKFRLREVWYQLLLLGYYNYQLPATHIVAHLSLFSLPF